MLMPCFKTVVAGLVLVLLPVLSQAEPLQPPLLERYVFDLGTSAGSDLTFLDPRLGNGNAFLRFEGRSRNPGVVDVRLEIGRHIPRDTITFALLVSGIKISFLDRAGETVREVNLQGESFWPGGFFVIGDSADGYFQFRKTLRDLRRARRVVIRVFGNYE